MSRKRLGRGLDALLSSSSSLVPVKKPGEQTASAEKPASGKTSALDEVAVTDVYQGRYQPRREFNKDALEELKESILKQGVMQPIVVRPRPQGGYELIAGERRWRATQLAGLETIPAVVRDVSDEDAVAMALIENIQREDLSPLEESHAMSRLKEEFDLTHEQVAEAVGKSRTAVTNLLRLLNLAPGVTRLLEQGRIEMGHARAVLSLEGQVQERLAQQIAARGLSVRQAEALVRQFSNASHTTSAPKQRKTTDTLRLERELTDKLGAKVVIDHDLKGKGQVHISYGSLDELEGVLEHLRK